MNLVSLVKNADILGKAIAVEAIPQPLGAFTMVAAYSRVGVYLPYALGMGLILGGGGLFESGSLFVDLR